MIEEVSSAAAIQNDRLSLLIQRFSVLKAMRITSWLLQFINNCMTQKTRRDGLLTTEEIQDSRATWIKWAQEKHSRKMRIGDDSAKPQLEKNKCIRNFSMQRKNKREQSALYPLSLYISNNEFAAMLVMNAHLKTFRGGLASTLADNRENYWNQDCVRLLQKDVMDTNNSMQYFFKHHNLNYFYLTKLKAAELFELLVSTTLAQ